MGGIFSTRLISYSDNELVALFGLVEVVLIRLCLVILSSDCQMLVKITRKYCLLKTCSGMV